MPSNSMDSLIIPFFVFLVCYMIGSFPSAYLIGLLNKVNIFKIGSGNMGTANVLRALGLKWGVLVFLLDMLKGVIAVTVAWLFPGDKVSAGVIGAIAAVLGHNWSLIATLMTGTLRGGKGAATAAGTWLVMMAPWPQLIVVTLGMWGMVVLITRYISLGVLIAVAVGTIWSIILIGHGGIIPQAYLYYVLFVAFMIYLRHRENIVRLLQGRERRVGERISA